LRRRRLQAAGDEQQANNASFSGLGLRHPINGSELPAHHFVFRQKANTHKKHA